MPVMIPRRVNIPVRYRRSPQLRLGTATALGLLLAASLTLIPADSAAAAGTTERVSVDSAGAEGNAFSREPSLSADGRFVAFSSAASNLVAGDTNGTWDVFVRDRQAGTVERVNVDSAGSEANGHSGEHSLSADGRFVAFSSMATNLVPGHTYGRAHVFVRDRQAGTTERVSVDSAGAEGNNFSNEPSLSADGRFVAFISNASNLVNGDNNDAADVFVRDGHAGTTERVSLDTAGAEANSYSDRPSISADGRFVAFLSFADNLVAGDTNRTKDVFVRDRQTGTTERVSVDSAGAGGGSALWPSLSADGRFVAFLSYADNLVAADTNNYPDAFVRDRHAGTTERVSVDTAGAEGNGWSGRPSISAEGRFVAFNSYADNLVAADTNGTGDVFVRDRHAGTTERVSVDTAGAEGNGWSDRPSLSADGRFVAFDSDADNLVPGDTNGTGDVFVREEVRTAANQPPTCTDASGTTPPNTALAANLSCADPDGDALTYAVVAGPSHGTLSAIASNGGFTYTPAPDYSGLDAFTAKASDGNGGEATTTYAVTVAQVPEETPWERAHRAFSRVLRPPDEENRDIFMTYVNMALAGASYDEIVTRITRDYVTQAYDKIFAVRNNPLFSPTNETAVRFNQEVYNRVLSWVKAPGPLYIDGTATAHGAEPIWSYVAKSASVWGAHSDERTGGDTCFGGAGSGCTGLGVEWAGGVGPYGVGEFQRLDGVEMHYISLNVAVGSIVHDRACLDPAYVAYCNGWPDQRSAENEDLCHRSGHSCLGVREWWKAWANTVDSRYWRYHFGPYPVDDARARTFKDDTRIVANRPAALPITNGDKELQYEYQNGEARATTVIFAPGGTDIDYTDAAFCMRGRASKTYTALNTTPWKECGGGSGGGGGGGGPGGGPPRER